VCDRCGSPDVLRLEDIPAPRLERDDDVLVKVAATSVNSWDWDLLTCTPWLMNRITAPRGPRHRVLGADVAGRVEAVGAAVTRFRPGDAVYGDVSGCGWGGLGEYVSVPDRVLAPMPAGLGFEQAAAVPQAGVLALQGLRYRGELRPGDAVLVNGAGGGVGTFAIQLAKASGALVTGVDSASKLDGMRSLGAHEVIDYRRERFSDRRGGYDRIVDVVLRGSIIPRSRALRPGGVYGVIGGHMRADPPDRGDRAAATGQDGRPRDPPARPRAARAADAAARGGNRRAGHRQHVRARGRAARVRALRDRRGPWQGRDRAWRGLAQRGQQLGARA
jgi:NADPH:quinone reductase-like Zn-dependent oxidoreductase